ncbi:MAG TPA: hypothetical protein VE967_00595 [Gemmatimonadaceae bacterium]|nr:hypothetical protein [Gemmatimonadaceae bacterium]
MRFAKLLTLALLAAPGVVPVSVPAQITITFGARLGPEVGLHAYSVQRMGDWRQSYRQWTPVTVYDVNGHFYLRNVRGSRPVLVYRYNNEYFFPPQDRDWNGFDRRYDYRRRPSEGDYERARPYADMTYDRRLGQEFGVVGYSPERAGDWRTNVRFWTPVLVFEFDGRYFQNSYPGARAVMVYRYQNEYFLPPNDQTWIGTDRRYDYNRQPTEEDRNRARRLDRDGRDADPRDNGRGRGRGGF